MRKAEQVTDRNGYKAPAVHKAFELLRAVAEAPRGVRLVDLAARVGFSTSTAHGLVHALLREKAIVQGEDDPRRLFLGPSIADLAFTDWNYIKVNRLGQPLINRLRDRVEATVFLGVRIRGRIMITAAAEARESFKISAPLGTTMPLCAGAVGKVFLSQEGPERIGALLAEKGLPKFTPNSITDVEQYISELDRVRARGFAVDDEEYLSGIRAVAVALRNRRGLPMAVWVVGIASNMGLARLEQVAEMALDAAKELRSRLEAVGGSDSKPVSPSESAPRLARPQADEGPALASNT